MKTVVLLSGGMDSLVCAAEAATTSHELYFLHLTYGQKTSQKERWCFDKISDFYRVPAERRKVIDMSFLRQIGGSSLTDDSIKIKTYAGDSNEIPSSYVPFRNSIILSLSVSWAEVVGASTIMIGANDEDSPGYPDCRPAYFQAFNHVVDLGTKQGGITIVTPVLKLRKAEIAARGKALGAPFELSWSCYSSSDKACGVCDSCAIRLRGFNEIRMVDPIAYQTKE